MRLIDRVDRPAVLALITAEGAALDELARQARDVASAGRGAVVSYSRKVFIPLTQLCRDVCHYCTFAQPPRGLAAPYLSADKAVALCRDGAAIGCKEALLTLGDRPERRYRVAREWLDHNGFADTIDYVAHVAERIVSETGLLPHINAGIMSEAQYVRLRRWAPSMGIMLESAAERLCEPGLPHHGSPDKRPAVRLASIAAAGRAGVPMTSGILIGIGETRIERIDALLRLRAVHDDHGHLQEIIVQNFRAKPGTRMADAPEPDLDELRWTIAVARLIFGAEMTIQVPPNLNPDGLRALLDAGIDDWGGVSPLTPDHVNPEAAWPEIARLDRETAAAGRVLQQRLTIHPRFVRDAERWIDPGLRGRVLAMSDADGLARQDDWTAGSTTMPPAISTVLCGEIAPSVAHVLDRAWAGKPLGETDLVELFGARGPSFTAVCKAADAMRRARVGDTVSYVINRNINYTNICGYRCGFCAFSKGRTSDALRGKPYRLDLSEIGERAAEAAARGATEVCMQGGIHPAYTGQTYLDICRAVKVAAPDMHIHAFSPLEVWQGARTLNLPVARFLEMLRDAGLSTLPGTAAEILDDEVRKIICPDKLDTRQWLEVVGTAHRLGMRTTATIMFGHVDRPHHWARHLLHIRALQAETGGFTEFVPLPFVAAETPIYLRGRARAGPTFHEAILMHAVARIAFDGMIDNIQASWVKLGPDGVRACLNVGVNDLGGTLMDESITRAAGAVHGQEFTADAMAALIRSAGRTPRQRRTDYVPADLATEGRAAISADMRGVLGADDDRVRHNYDQMQVS